MKARLSILAVLLILALTACGLTNQEDEAAEPTTGAQVEPSQTASPTASVTASQTATQTSAAALASNTPLSIPSQTASQTSSVTPSLTLTLTPAPSLTPLPSNTASATTAPSSTPIPPSATATASLTHTEVALLPSNTPSATLTSTASLTSTATVTASLTATVTASETPTATVTASETPTATTTASETPTATVTASETPTATVTASETPTATTTASETPTATTTASETPAEVAAANQPPVVQAIPNQLVEVGQVLSVAVQASDPEGFNTSFSAVESGSTQILLASADGGGNIRLEGLTPGQVNVRLVVTDGVGGETITLFTVEVIETTPVANLPPLVEPIPDQSLALGEIRTLPIQASDPEGSFPFISNLESSAASIVSVAGNDNRGVEIFGESPGQAFVTVTLQDADGQQASIRFSVQVALAPTPTPNQPPVVQPIFDQVVIAGQTVTAFVQASDPEGVNVFFESVASSADSIATAAPDGQGNILVTGVSAGLAEVEAVVSDGLGGLTTARFQVEVQAAEVAQANLPPQVEAIPPQTVTQDQFLPLAIVASDPEGGALSFSLSSADESIAVGQVNEGNLTVLGLTPGQTSITLTASDDTGAATSVVFSLSVLAPDGSLPPSPTPLPPADVPPDPAAGLIDLNSLPLVPNWTGEVLNRAQQQNLALDAKPLDEYLLIVGDVVPAQVYTDGAGGSLGLGDPTIYNLYTAIPANATPYGSNPAWTSADLLNPANLSAECAGYAHPVQCAAALATPSVAVVFIGRNDALQGVDPAIFQANLEGITAELRSRNIIVILTTIPGDSRVDPYNQAIARVAQGQNWGLWNLWRQIPAAQVNPDLTLTAPPTADGGANPEIFGATARAFTLWDIISALRTAVLLN